MRAAFRILDVAPLTYKPEEKRIGIIIQKENSQDSLVTVWDLARNVEITNHVTKDKVSLRETPSNLYFVSEKYARDVVTGIRAAEFNTDAGDKKVNINPLQIASQAQVCVEYDDEVPASKRTMRILLPSKRWHSNY